MNYGYTVDKDNAISCNYLYIVVIYQAFFEFTLPMGELNYT